MTIETYIDLINGLNNQVDNLKRSLLEDFYDKSVWIYLDDGRQFLTFLYPVDNNHYHVTLERYSANGSHRCLNFQLSDIKQLKVHDHRLVIVL